MTTHRSRVAVALGALGLLLAAGCATIGRKPAPPTVRIPPAEVPPVTTKPVSSPATGPAAPTTPPPSTVTPPGSATAGALVMLVESAPAGAVIVVDGRPVGKTPLRLEVPATALGFFQDYVEVRARFVATGEGEESRTAMEEFTPREKVPAVLQFTPDGAQRTLR